MNNFVQPGEVLELTAPVGGVVSGTLYIIGGLPVVAAVTAAAGATFAAHVCGVFELPKTAAQAWAEGDRIYWNAGTSKAENLSASGLLIGVAAAAAANPSATGKVRLNGSAPGLLEGPQPAVADLTDNGGGAAADGTIGVVTAPTALTDNGAGTADGTVEAMTDPADAPGTPDALRDDLVANFCLSVRNNVKELTTRQAENRTAIIALTDAVKELSTKQNALLAALRTAGIIAT